MALMRRPRVLLLDEPSLGLAPAAVSKTFEYIVRLRDTWSLTVIVAEQKVNEVLAISDRVCALRTGSVVFFGTPSEIQEPQRMRSVFL